MKPTPRRLAVVAVFAALATIAQAHPGHDGHELTWDFATGFAHPFTGWDHILAMVTVGWWTTLLGGRARWLVAGTFLALLTLGSFVPAWPITLSVTEQGIAASLVALGVLVATAVRMPEWPAAVLVGVFAVFHGVAHGAEMSGSANALEYRLGFVAASAALIGLGMLVATLSRRARHHPERLAGAAVALAGVVLLVR